MIFSTKTTALVDFFDFFWWHHWYCWMLLTHLNLLHITGLVLNFVWSWWICQRHQCPFRRSIPMHYDLVASPHVMPGAAQVYQNPDQKRAERATRSSRSWKDGTKTISVEHTVHLVFWFQHIFSVVSFIYLYIYYCTTALFLFFKVFSKVFLFSSFNNWVV